MCAHVCVCPYIGGREGMEHILMHAFIGYIYHYANILSYCTHSRTCVCVYVYAHYQCLCNILQYTVPRLQTFLLVYMLIYALHMLAYTYPS